VERPFDLGGVRWWPAAGADPETVRRAARRALEALEAGRLRNLKAGRRKALYHLALLRPGEPDHLLKVTRYPALVGLRRRLLGSKSRRELRLAEAIARRGVATPVPLAAGERRARGRVLACYLLVPFVRGARDLRQVAAAGGLPAAARRELARGFGAFARRVHDAGVWQGDFQPNNFLLGPRGPADLLLIDYERVRLRRALPLRARAAMLAKLERELGAARLAERARFLHAYAGGDRADARRCWRAVAAEVRALAGRDAARLERLTAQAGRRFAPIGLAGWRGVRAASTDAGALGRALEALLAAAPRTQAQGFALAAGRSAFALRFETAARGSARRGFARALLLARRGGLAPTPVALLERRGEALLVFEGPLPEALDALDAEARRAAHPALIGLLLRLSALGALEAPSARLVARGAAGAPTLLAPPLLAPGGRGAPPDRRAARALASRLLGLDPV
jgi:hypothetical protein